jgi:outer membrane protein TolC
VILQAKNGRREAEALVLSDVRFRLRKLEEARAAIDTARLRKEASRERLRITMNRYQEKAALLKDVLQDEASFRDATRKFDGAVLDLWKARADLEKAMGVD